jgi:HAD superfamily hydrolase (TIGR01549 family)
MHIFSGGVAMRFTHVIWDYDGTLFNTYPVMAAALCSVFQKYGIIETVGDIIAFMKVSMGNAVQYYSERHQLDNDFWERYRIVCHRAELNDTQPFDGAVELCHTIKKYGGKNYLFTHRGESSVYFLEKYGLLADFEEIITSKQNFPRKPSPDAILYLMNKYGFSKKEAIMIGDRDIDILAGKNAGINTCYFSDGGELSDHADMNIRHFSELLNLLIVP